MIGLDTNVLVRYIMQDDPRQSPKANRVVDSLTTEAPGYVSVVSIVELGWVLETAYALSRADVASAFEALLRTKELVIDRAEQVSRALKIYASTSADFADCLIERSAAAVGCSATVTFDVGASKVAGMVLIR